MDLLGDDYIAQHVQQQILQERRERLYRAYITDALWAVSQHNRAMTAHWRDLDPGYAVAQKPQESAESVKTRLMSKINEEAGADESI